MKYTKEDFEILQKAELHRQLKLNAIEDSHMKGTLAGERLRMEADQTRREVYVVMGLEEPELLDKI
jgi:hypothetical protein